MDPLEALVLGIVQGLTEWLPVSSSGHLVIAQELLGMDADENLLFDLVVHLGTIVAVVAYFRKELWRVIVSMTTPKARRGEQENALRKLGFLLLLGTVPAGIAGILLTDYIESIFDIKLVGVALMANAVLLFAAERFGNRGAKKTASTRDAIVIGTFQAVSIMPGISRSGSTLSGGMFMGLEREAAAVFAFLLSVPILLAAFAYGLVTLDTFDLDIVASVIGAGAAFATGIVSIGYLLKAVRAGKLWIFSGYCMVVGAAVLLLSL